MTAGTVSGLGRAPVWRRRLLTAARIALLLVLMLGRTEGPRAQSMPVNFTLVNDTGEASDARVLSFGQIFPSGAIYPGKAVSVSLNNIPVQSQIDPKALWPDGSVRHAVVSLLLPKMRRGEKLTGVIMPAANAAAMVPLTPGPAPALRVTLAFASAGGRADFDLPTLVRNDKGKSWLEGPLVRERRYMGRTVNGIQLAFDVWWPVTGAPRVDVIFHNDRSDDADVDTHTYDADIVLDGQVVYHASDVHQYAHSVWHKRVGGGAAPAPRVLPDLALLKQTGAIPRYGDIYPDPRAMEKLGAATIDEGAPPLDAAGLTMYMPTTGGRADIGPLPTWAVFYLLDPSRDNEDWLMAKGDAAGAVPWHVRDDATGGPIRIDQHPTVWLDGRGQAVPGALARKYYVSDTKWTPDDAHQPSLSYLPYLLTGSQFYRDELAMQAGYVLLAMDPAYRGGADGIVLGSQVRAVAWDLRTLANAAFLLPARDPLQAYFEGRLAANLQAITDRYVQGHEVDAAGELKGYLPGPYAVDGAVAPWQDDYLVMVLGWIDQMGFRQARPVLHWMANFTAGRFTNGARGYDPIYGTPYFLYVREPNDGPWINTWAGAFQRTFDPDKKPVTSLDYPDWGGGYAALARGALATLLNVDPSPQVAAAYDFVHEHTRAMTDHYAQDPTFAIAPPVRTGQASRKAPAGLAGSVAR
jgi:hypothetical protein